MSDPERLSVTLTREFDAPIDLVYAAWTDARQVTRWMKCDAAVVLTCKSWEPAVGARFETVMEMPGQWRVEGSGRFTEVDPPRLLAYVNDADEALNMPETSVRVELEELEGNRTRLTLTHTGLPNDDMCGIVTGGWTHSLSALDEVLSVQA